MYKFDTCTVFLLGHLNNHTHQNRSSISELPAVRTIWVLKGEKVGVPEQEQRRQSPKIKVGDISNPEHLTLFCSLN